jgi:hypothetical protein
MSASIYTLFCCSLLLITTGCAEVTPPDLTSNETPVVAEVEPTLAPSLTIHVTSTARPTATPVLPTPVFPFETDPDFLFSGQSDTCTLPCWHELEVGTSATDDIQNVLAQVFGFNEVNKFPDVLEGNTIPGLYGAGHQWLFHDDSGANQGQFDVTFWVSEESRLLEGMEFTYYRQPQSSLYAPRTILQKLGKPSTVLTSISPTEAATAFVPVLFIYDEGIVFYYELSIPIIEHFAGDGMADSSVAHLCLTDNSYINIFLSAPIEHDLPQEAGQLTQMQYSLFGNYIEFRELTSFSDWFDVSNQELVEIAQEPGDSCIDSRNLLEE